MHINVLKILKHTLTILHECVDVTEVANKQKNVLGLPPFLTFLVVFVHFVLRSSNGREPSNIFIRNFNYQSLLKYEVIAAVTTGV